MLLSLLPRLFLLLPLTSLLIALTCSKDDREAYIVYMGGHPMGVDPSSLPSLHTTLAQNVLGRDFAPEFILHSYWKSFNGFVIKLTHEEAKTMAEMDNVVSVFPDRKTIKMHTTRSWDFIGFPQNVKRTTLESDTIVGVIDSGIWPKSKSFSDKGFGPPPSKWKGSCHNFTCNNKIIGAKYYRVRGEIGKEEIPSPIDVGGHSTHTASTVAGNLVGSASMLGLAAGTARGGVPSARIAVYKVLWAPNGQSYPSDVLAAFDDAIRDGVDIISISAGGETPTEYFRDPIAVGALHAMQRGILTSNSAGNEGPSLYTISTLPPWVLSVAASTIDRKFSNNLHLGNGMVFDGVSVNTFDLKDKYYPLIHGRDAPNVRGGYNSSLSRLCFEDSLDKRMVKGKIVLCDVVFLDSHGLAFRAAGVITATYLSKDAPDVSALPAIEISEEDGTRILSYMNSNRNSTATISRTYEEKDLSAPNVASFSSRGPDPFAPNVLKPDITAPGVDILATWSSKAPLSGVKYDKRDRRFKIMSGTSMACPHATAVAAYVKTFHPRWSPSAIKSALMTTAVPMSAALNPDAEFAYGAGQINPLKAVNPGLVYDAGEIDYIKFLCSRAKYDDERLQYVTRNSHSSCAKFKNETLWDLNLPSFTHKIIKTPFIVSFNRTVTNVGSSKSKYKANISAPGVANIQVRPKVLHFTSVGQKKSFTLTVEGRLNVEILSASLVWDDGTHQVRSPIVLYSNQITYHPLKDQEADT